MFRSKYKGVTREPGQVRWRARAFVGGKLRCFGSYDTEEEAHAAYVKARESYVLQPRPKKKRPEPDSDTGLDWVLSQIHFFAKGCRKNRRTTFIYMEEVLKAAILRKDEQLARLQKLEKRLTKSPSLPSEPTWKPFSDLTLP